MGLDQATALRQIHQTYELLLIIFFGGGAAPGILQYLLLQRPRPTPEWSVVTHPSANRGPSCLTSLFLREPEPAYLVPNEWDLTC